MAVEQEVREHLATAKQELKDAIKLYNSILKKLKEGGA